MVLGKILQGIALVLLLGSLNLATAATIREWEGSFDENESEDTMSRGFGEEAIPDSEETDSSGVVEVAMIPQRPNEIKVSRKGLALVQFPSNTARGIKDETATTGENAKKRLPPSIKQNEVNHQSPYLHEINHVIPYLLTVATP